jgi:hypothetical protein
MTSLDDKDGNGLNLIVAMVSALTIAIFATVFLMNTTAVSTAHASQAVGKAQASGVL